MKSVFYHFDKLAAVYGQRDMVNDTTLYLKQGESLFLLGDRDSGRIAFFDCLCGYINKTDGRIYRYAEEIGEEEFRKRIVIISDIRSDYKSLNGVSVLEYLFLFRDDEPEMIWNPKKKEKAACDLLKIADLKIDVHADIMSLKRCERLQLELIKAVDQGAELLLMNEDFDDIDTEEMNKLYKIISLIRKDKNISLIISTNGLKGVRILADRVAIFNNHTIVRYIQMEDDFSFDKIEKTLSVIRAIPDIRQTDTRNNKEIFRAENIFTDGDNKINIAIKENEIVSIVVIDVKEKLRIFRCLTGQEKGVKLYLDNRLMPDKWYNDRLKYPVIGIESLGIRSLYPKLSVEENLVFPSYQKLSNDPFIKKDALSSAKRDWYLRHPDCAETVQEMSLADRLSLQLESWWIFRPRILILLEPFLHLDRQGRGILSQYFTRFKERGTSLIVLSESRNNYLREDVISLKENLFDRMIVLEEEADIS